MIEDAPRPIVVAGPTASGKTAAALAIARRVGGELIGADSVQVYRGFDIGSSKPTVEELGGIPHHLIDILDPDEEIDAMAYARLADEAIAGVHSRGALPIVVGGTGLWLRALFRGLVDLPPVDAALRARLEAEADRLGPPAFHRRLATVDSKAAAAIHPNDKLRIVRGLEVYEQTGQALGDLREAHRLGAPRYDHLFVVLDPPMDALTARVEARVDVMLEAGWVEEVRRLRERWGDEVRAFGKVGYQQVLEHLRDGVSLEETHRRVARANRTYAKRQRTWFRGEPGVHLRTRYEELAGDEGRLAIEGHLER